MTTQTILFHGKHAFKNVLRATRKYEVMTSMRQRCPQHPGLIIAPNHRNIALFHTCNNVYTNNIENKAIVSKDVIEGEGPWMSDLRQRGFYSEIRYGHYNKYKINSFSISEDKKHVFIEWNDGHTSNFDAIWLRHACHCGDCKHDINGMVKIEWQSLPLDISVLSAEIEDDKMMVFRWGTPDGQELHLGAIPKTVLRSYCYSDKAVKEKRKKRAMKFYEDRTIPHMEYEELLESEKSLSKCVTHIGDRGLCLVKNLPLGMEIFLETVERFGVIKPTLYGHHFEVVAVENPVNFAYSSQGLPLHMDLVFYEAAPGLQILSCQKFAKDATGGGNTFLDLHEVAHKFRDEFPEFFDRLSKFPVTYVSIHYNRKQPCHMENQKTIFSLNHLGELVSVVWHPGIQAPVEMPKEDMMLFYEAYTAFYKMVSQYESVYKIRFNVGDCLFFNNRRVLHGRDAYTGDRHLYGAYIELSDFQSYLQVLHNKYGNGRIAPRVGTLSWS